MWALFYLISFSIFLPVLVFYDSSFQLLSANPPLCLLVNLNFNETNREDARVVCYLFPGLFNNTVRPDWICIWVWYHWIGLEKDINPYSFFIFYFWSRIFDKSSKFGAASCKNESSLLLVWITDVFIQKLHWKGLGNWHVTHKVHNLYFLWRFEFYFIKVYSSLEIVHIWLASVF